MRRARRVLLGSSDRTSNVDFSWHSTGHHVQRRVEVTIKAASLKPTMKIGTLSSSKTRTYYEYDTYNNNSCTLRCSVAGETQVTSNSFFSLLVKKEPRQHSDFTTHRSAGVSRMPTLRSPSSPVRKERDGLYALSDQRLSTRI